MKFITFLLVVCCVFIFASCVDRMDIVDTVPGTPTRMDTVVKRNYVPPVKKESPKKEEPSESE